MELVYRLATETSPLHPTNRDNVIVSGDACRRRRPSRSQRRLVQPRSPDGRGGGTCTRGAGAAGGGGGGALPYWGK